MNPDRVSDHKFIAASAVIFTASTAATIASCVSMRTMGMDMPGGWTMSMYWMRMPGQTWIAAAAAFLCMWTVMMAAMMLPSLIPMLRDYRRTAGHAAAAQLDFLTAIVALGYFSIWMFWGLLAFPIGTALADIAMAHPDLARVIPIAVGLTIIVAGLTQFTPWKMRQLSCCRTGQGQTHTPPSSPDARTAWSYGVKLGLHCSSCCFGLMTILLVIGVMDVRAMTVITAAITVERWAPNPVPIVRLIGVLAVFTGIILIARQLMT